VNKDTVAGFRDEMEKIAMGLPHVLAGGLIGLLLGARLWRNKDKKEQEREEGHVVRQALPQMVGSVLPPGAEATPLMPPRNKINRMHDALRAYALEPEAGEVNPEEDFMNFGSLGALTKINQAPGSLAHRAQLGAPGAWGSLQQGGGGGAGGAADAAPAAPAAPSGPPGGSGGDPLGGAGGSLSASDLGIGGGNPLGGAAKTPSAGDLGISSGGDPMGGSAGAGKTAEPPPPTTAATGQPPAAATAAGRMAASQKASQQVQGALGGGFQPGQAKGESASSLDIPE
jgi:hypothetical protein